MRFGEKLTLRSLNRDIGEGGFRVAKDAVIDGKTEVMKLYTASSKEAMTAQGIVPEAHDVFSSILASTIMMTSRLSEKINHIAKNFKEDGVVSRDELLRGKCKSVVPQRSIVLLSVLKGEGDLDEY